MAVKYPYIAAGFKEDCIKLLSIFKEQDNIRFETFCKTWQEMKFSLVFLCRESFVDLLEFCEEALHIAKQFILLPNTFKEQIGGLYLLYGLYYKMPLENAVKIRITLVEFNQIKELHKAIKEGEHFDANYILSKMFIDNAFLFCIFSKEMGLQKQHKINQNQNIHNHLSILPDIQNMNKSEGLLQKINDLSNQYDKNKIELSKKTGTEKVNLFDSSLISNIITEVVHINKLRNNSMLTSDLHLSKNMRKPLSKSKRLLEQDFSTDTSEDDKEDDETQENKYQFKTELIKSGTQSSLSENSDEEFQKEYLEGRKNKLKYQKNDKMKYMYEDDI